MKKHKRKISEMKTDSEKISTIDKSLVRMVKEKKTKR